MRYPLRIEKTLTLSEGSSVLRVDEVLTNLGEQDIEFAWLQHIVFGKPIVGPGMSVDMRAGACTAGAYKQTRLKPAVEFEWPSAPASDGSVIDMSGAPPTGARYEDNLYVTMREPWYAIRNSLAGLTVGVSWDLNVLPLALVLAEQRGSGLSVVGAVVQPRARAFEQRDGAGHPGVHGEGQRAQAPRGRVDETRTEIRGRRGVRQDTERGLRRQAARVATPQGFGSAGLDHGVARTTAGVCERCSIDSRMAGRERSPHRSGTAADKHDRMRKVGLRSWERWSGERAVSAG